MTEGEFAPELRPDSILRAARKVAAAPYAELAEWGLEPLAKSATTVNAVRVLGVLTDRRRTLPFSLVLKRRQGPLESDRETLAYQSGLLDQLRSQANGLSAPACLVIEEQSSAERWLWLEDCSETPGYAWPVERYGLAAYHLGRFNGNHPDGAARDLASVAAGSPAPMYSWLGGGFLRGWVGLP